MRKILFEPQKIGNLILKNRFAFAATGMGTSNRDGSVTDQALCHYVARAKGGAGLIIVENTFCTKKYGVNLLCFYSDHQLPGYRDLAEVIHFYGSVAIVQLSLGAGRQGNPIRLGAEIVAPSPIAYNIEKGTAPKGLKWMEGAKGSLPRELTISEIAELENLYVDSAERIKKAGFDGIEIHGCNGHLLSQFVSPLTNKRLDKYGGSFHNRLTLSKNIIRKVRDKLGSKFVLGYRICGNEHVNGGISLDDTIKIVKVLENEGVDYIHLSSGCISSLKWVFPEKDGAILPEAKALKKVCKVPIICPNIHSPELAEIAVKEKQTDIVSMSRPLLADPDFPNKVKSGKEEKINKCILCNSCISSLWQMFGTRCKVNSAVGKERFIKKYYPPIK